VFSQIKFKGYFVPSPIPIPVLTCPCPPELELPSTNSYGYWSQSSPALNRTCSAPSSRILWNMRV